MREIFVCPRDLEQDLASRWVAGPFSVSARLLCTFSPSLRIKHGAIPFGEGPTLDWSGNQRWDPVRLAVAARRTLRKRAVSQKPLPSQIGSASISESLNLGVGGIATTFYCVWLQALSSMGCVWTLHKRGPPLAPSVVPYSRLPSALPFSARQRRASSHIGLVTRKELAPR